LSLPGTYLLADALANGVGLPVDHAGIKFGDYLEQIQVERDEPALGAKTLQPAPPETGPTERQLKTGIRASDVAVTMVHRVHLRFNKGQLRCG